MTTHFLFPADGLRPKGPDAIFADVFSALRAAGFTASLCSDANIHGRKPLGGIPAGSVVVYRGWMLNAADYSRLAVAVAAASATLFTSPDSYLSTHHLPNWYPLIKEFTPETKVLPLTADFEGELRDLGWDAYFVKDYVKSLKTSVGSIIHDPAQITKMINEMKRFRGELEGGLCVRRVEEFQPDAERRYFVLNGKAFSATEEGVPHIVDAVARRIPSRFFSVDIVRRLDGVLRVVEIGDGQVSDLVGWSPEAFATIWVVGLGEASSSG